jgi:hypothetical protein
VCESEIAHEVCTGGRLFACEPAIPTDQPDVYGTCEDAVDVVNAEALDGGNVWLQRPLLP